MKFELLTNFLSHVHALVYFYLFLFSIGSQHTAQSYTINDRPYSMVQVICNKALLSNIALH